MEIVVGLLLSLVAGAYAGDSSGMVLIGDDVSFDLGSMNDLGYWTAWLNGDSPRGTGDYENVVAWVYNYNYKPWGNCGMPCKFPMAVQWELKDKTLEDEIDKCVVLEVDRMPNDDGIFPGFNCQNAKQDNTNCTVEECQAAKMRTGKRGYTCDKCPDFQVRYFCPYESSDGKPIKRAVSSVTCEPYKREMALQALDMRLNEERIEAEMEEDKEIAEIRALHAQELAEKEALKEKKESEKKENAQNAKKKLITLLQDLLNEKN